MKKELIELIKIKEGELERLKDKLEKINNCHHEWQEVEIGGRNRFSKCVKCGILKDEK